MNRNFLYCGNPNRDFLLGGYPIDGFYFRASRHKNNKYDVYDGKTDIYITSFGSKRHMHYRDRIGFYAYLDNKDKIRQINYLKRHKNKCYTVPHPLFFSIKYLWHNEPIYDSTLMYN